LYCLSEEYIKFEKNKHTHLSKSGFVSDDTNPNSERGKEQPKSDLNENEIPL
jgi:hypothetical protein